eukprot:1158150-Pelagomonas_calceolata.AAC.1
MSSHTYKGWSARLVWINEGCVSNCTTRRNECACSSGWANEATLVAFDLSLAPSLTLVLRAMLVKSGQNLRFAFSGHCIRLVLILHLRIFAVS